MPAVARVLPRKRLHCLSQFCNDVAEAAIPVITSPKLFFALWPDSETRKALTTRGKSMHKTAGGRMTRPENLHLTLAFLGPTDATRLAELEAVAVSVKPAACSLVLDDAGYWKHNSIVWAGATKVPDKLGTLVEELREALKKNGFRFDPKPFKPHVTLIRDAHDPGEPVKRSIRWKVGGFSLVRAYRDEQGLLYRVVSSCPKVE